MNDQGVNLFGFHGTQANPIINQLVALLGQKLSASIASAMNQNQSIISPIPKQEMISPLARNPVAQTTIPTATPTPTPQYDPNVFNGYVMSTPRQYIPYINKSAKQYGIPTKLLSGVLAHESMRWSPDVISGKIKSPAGAQGIAQFMPDTAKGMGIDPLDVSQAIPAAARKLSSHIRQFGDTNMGLAAYNAGAGNVQKYGGIPPFSETQNYIKYINQDMQQSFGNPDYYKL